MRRSVMQKLTEWKDSEDRKPLILKGARQVGKTWLMKEFGKSCYDSFVYFNFDEEDELKSIFKSNKNPQRIIELLGFLSSQKIIPGKTLIIFDEIQECPDALNSLKYFKENASQYHVVSAGSLLGTLLAQPKSYPVGMVNLIDISPLTFEEFLSAIDEQLYAYYSSVVKAQRVEEIFHDRLLEVYNYYLIIGGMPECVASWIRYKDPAKISQIQKELVAIYENDFAKHNGKVNSGRILLVFRSIVTQLAKENEKFIFGCVKEGARAREFEEAIEWLVSAGMLYRLYNVSKPEHPLSAFDQLNQFKLFLFDTGILKHMAGIDNAAILLKSDFQFKGPLTENYILQQLRGQFEVEPRYFSDKSGEIDFLIQRGVDIIPIEVKSGENKKAASFKTFIRNRKPPIAVRFSRRGYVKDGEITNIPLYLAGKMKELL
ncbi:MAG: ATP-binding protein [Eubacteriales bacterium]|nr:ATP-binding protein [Eubacteriales bacterium]MDD3350637.1 ATP-binding protein [Eubacteriales bacterium]